MPCVRPGEGHQAVGGEQGSDWIPDIDTSKPSPARIYDYALGGKDNFAVDREVVLLRYYEGLNASQISERLGIPAGTVRWRLSRGLDVLRADEHDRPVPRRVAGADGTAIAIAACDLCAAAGSGAVPVSQPNRVLLPEP